MKSPSWRRILSCAALLCAIVVVTDASAKKPVKPPPDPSGDTCDTMQTFVPDFAFWRDTGNRKTPRATIYVAEAETGCERKLVDVFVGENEWIENIRFSTIEEGGVSGRVMWRTRFGPSRYSVWFQDFTVDGTDISLTGSKRELLHNFYPGPQTPYILSVGGGMDLSPDMATLALTLIKVNESGGDVLSLRLLNVDELIQACSEDSCPPLPLDLENDAAFLLDEITDADVNSDDLHFWYPSWGPLGERLYVIDQYVSDLAALQYYDLDWPESSWPPQATGPETLFSASDYPDISNIKYFREPKAGIADDGREYIAIRIGIDYCPRIFVLDVAACEADPADCIPPEPMFAGRFPSWTKNGDLVHEYLGWTDQGNCHDGDLGVWDGDTLKFLMKGREPDAAGGLNISDD